MNEQVIPRSVQSVATTFRSCLPALRRSIETTTKRDELENRVLHSALDALVGITGVLRLGRQSSCKNTYGIWGLDDLPISPTAFDVRLAVNAVNALVGLQREGGDNEELGEIEAVFRLLDPHSPWPSPPRPLTVACRPWITPRALRAVQRLWKEQGVQGRVYIEKIDHRDGDDVHFDAHVTDDHGQNARVLHLPDTLVFRHFESDFDLLRR